MAIGSPEQQNARGELLDMERELRLILDAVDGARRQGRAYVKVLETGSLATIGQALNEQRYHVLHLSCHARPGALVLEDDQGREVEVTAEDLYETLAPAGGVPLVVLGGCSTGLPERKSAPSTPSTASTGSTSSDEGEGEKTLPSLARGLLETGIPAAVAMQAPVGDGYATELCAALYQVLSTHEQTDPLSALTHARRAVEKLRRSEKSEEKSEVSNREDLAQWATPALFLRGPSLPLYDLKAKPEEIKEAPEAHFEQGVVVRRVGEFVGRRRELRQLRRVLRDQDTAGALIHGIGGVGKSTLAAQVLHDLAAEGWIVASVAGDIDDPEKLFAAIGTTLITWSVAAGRDETDLLRQAASALRIPNLEWGQRLQILLQAGLARDRLVVLLDNFESNLDDAHQVSNEPLAALLSGWLLRPGNSRLLITSRYPFELPGEAHFRQERLHLGPLTPAETRKLIWRLPGLNALDRKDQVRAYAEVGGHPRALEYLDALLRGGVGRFRDISQKLREALEKRNIDDPMKWCQEGAGDLDRALAETITLATDDVLLDELLSRLDDHPQARGLLLGAAVYRHPVDKLGLVWQVAEESEPPEADETRRAALVAAMEQALDEGKLPEPSAGTSREDLIEGMLALMKGPPVTPPPGFEESLGILETLSLLARIPGADDEAEPLRYVHRWTARALEGRTAPEALREAHRRAANYWRWRVKHLPRPKQADIEELLEARFHHHRAGETEEAVAVSYTVCDQLDDWGAWQRAERICKDTLPWIPTSTEPQARFLHLLGILAQKRGDYDQALQWYRKSLDILEELGNRAGMASSYHQLGMVAQERGDYDQALQWYRKSLDIFEELGNRAGMASSYHQLGIVAEDRGDYDQALQWYRKSLDIKEELGNRAGMGDSMGQIAILLTEWRKPEEAISWGLKALAIHLPMQVPTVRIHLHWLTRQRELVGEGRFGELLGEHLDQGSKEAVLKMLDEFGQEGPARG